MCLSIQLHLIDVTHGPGVHVDPLHDEEAARRLGLLRVAHVLGRLLLQQLLEVLSVVVPEVLDLAPRGVQALLDREVDAFISGKMWVLHLGCNTSDTQLNN